MARLVQAEPGQTFKVDGKVYEADANGIVAVKDKHLPNILQFGLKEVKHVDNAPDVPTHRDDATKGFSVGSLWHSFVGLFRCASNRAQAAVWETISEDQTHLPELFEPPAPEPVITVLAVDPENEAAAAAALAGLPPLAPVEPPAPDTVGAVPHIDNHSEEVAPAPVVQE